MNVGNDNNAMIYDDEYTVVNTNEIEENVMNEDEDISELDDMDHMLDIDNIHVFKDRNTLTHNEKAHNMSEQENRSP